MTWPSAAADELRRLPNTSWIRLQRMIEDSPTALLLVAGAHVACGPGGVSLALTPVARGMVRRAGPRPIAARPLRRGARRPPRDASRVLPSGRGLKRLYGCLHACQPLPAGVVLLELARAFTPRVEAIARRDGAPGPAGLRARAGPARTTWARRSWPRRPSARRASRPRSRGAARTALLVARVPARPDRRPRGRGSRHARAAADRQPGPRRDRRQLFQRWGLRHAGRPGRAAGGRPRGALRPGRPALAPRRRAARTTSRWCRRRRRRRSRARSSWTGRWTAWSRCPSCWRACWSRCARASWNATAARPRSRWTSGSWTGAAIAAR